MRNADGRTVVVLGTGGTIAGVSTRPGDLVGYVAGAVDAAALLAAVPALADAVAAAGFVVDCETVARLDSSDMDHATWATLRERAAFHLRRDDVAGVVVTHGTDTLEETAYFLHRTVAEAAVRPLVLTAAMRPSSAPSPDGPQNLIDAMAVACAGGARGVVAVLAGRVHAAADLRKVHGWRVDAFSSGEAGAIGVVEDGTLRRFRGWPTPLPHAAAAVVPRDAAAWPAVEIVTSHAGAGGRVVDALIAGGVAGIVVAGTGNGSVHRDLEAAARRAIAAGVAVRRASRCLLGGVVGGRPGALPSAGPLTPVQARIELMLDLIADRAADRR